MSDLVKEVVANFTKMDPSDITSMTVINSKALLGSIQMHRMYAQLAERGVIVENYVGIQTFGQLLERLNTSGNGNSNSNGHLEYENVINTNHTSENRSYAVGIDMEPTSSFTLVVDFREDEFYKQNFHPSEISYCIVQPNQLQSFAGLFAAKEALVKADNHLLGRAFNSIVITHSDDGKPQYEGFQISISHTDSLAVAVAVQLPNQESSSMVVSEVHPRIHVRQLSWVLPFALTLSLAVIILWLVVVFLLGKK
jgi:phosphopantetheine--protein transferase-like protein